MAQTEEELRRLRLESLGPRPLPGGWSHASKPTDKLDAEQLAARIGATPPPSDSRPAERSSAPWRRALRS